MSVNPTRGPSSNGGLLLGTVTMTLQKWLFVGALLVGCSSGSSSPEEANDSGTPSDAPAETNAGDSSTGGDSAPTDGHPGGDTATGGDTRPASDVSTDTGCTPACSGRECGSDGCGGSCGTCPGGAPCKADGTCTCTPDCTGKACGDDGCGGSCGDCASDQTCTSGACTGGACGAVTCGSAATCCHCSGTPICYSLPPGTTCASLGSGCS